MDIFSVAIDPILSKCTILVHTRVSYSSIAVPIQAIHRMHTVNSIHSVDVVTADIAQCVDTIYGTDTCYSVYSIDGVVPIHEAHSIPQPVAHPIHSTDSVHLCYTVQSIHRPHAT